MKRALTILSIVLLAGVFLYACGIIPNAKTSIVTIRIGDTPNRAVLKAEAATPWTRMKHLLAEVDLVPSAEAYIPSVVQAIVVTVTAPDISVPIVAVKSIKDTDLSAVIQIDVPNGNARKFTVDGIRGVDSSTYYQGVATADLSGADVTLPISMAFVGPGIWVSPTGADQSTCGSAVTPCLTINYVLTNRPSTTINDVILVSSGTYTLNLGAGANTLQLKQGNALLCLGSNFSTVVDASNTTDDLVYGADGASVDNCKLIPGSDTTAIHDQGTRIKVNGVLIDANQAVGGALDGIILSADSLVLETSVLNTTFHGINVLSGKPMILNSVLAFNPVGVEISSTAGNVIVGGSDVSNNTTGINVSSTASPRISTSRISSNSTAGVAVSNGSAELTDVVFSNNGIAIDLRGGTPKISNNTITENSTGISISAPSNQTINNNSIYCNFFLGVDIISSTAQVNLQNNAWTHDTNTSPPGPVLNTGNCFSGDDICYSISPPAYLPILPSPVPNGCPIVG